MRTIYKVLMVAVALALAVLFFYEPARRWLKTLAIKILTNLGIVECSYKQQQPIEPLVPTPAPTPQSKPDYDVCCCMDD